MSSAMPTRGVIRVLRYDLNLADIAEVWRRGSVVGSYGSDRHGSSRNPRLTTTGFVEDSGEGRWTIMAAIESAVPVEVLSASLYTRFRSRQEHTFSEKVLSAMRNKFGGHVEQHNLGVTVDEKRVDTGREVTRR